MYKKGNQGSCLIELLAVLWKNDNPHGIAHYFRGTWSYVY